MDNEVNKIDFAPDAFDVALNGYVRVYDGKVGLVVRESTDLDGCPVILMPVKVHPDHIESLNKYGWKDVHFDYVTHLGEKVAANIRKATFEEWKEVVELRKRKPTI